MLFFWCADAMSLAFTHCPAEPHPAIRMDLHSELSVYCFFPPGRQLLGKAQNLRNFQIEFSFFSYFCLCIVLVNILPIWSPVSFIKPHRVRGSLLISVSLFYAQMKAKEISVSSPCTRNKQKPVSVVTSRVLSLGNSLFNFIFFPLSKTSHFQFCCC